MVDDAPAKMDAIDPILPLSTRAGSRPQGSTGPRDISPANTLSKHPLNASSQGKSFDGA
jgi:hypothetical protein